MWRQSTTAALLACCLWLTKAQSIWDDPITFRTKAKDSCAMTVTGQGEFTRLRLTCRGNEHSYWCEYVGKPYACRAYNKNPRHFFVQMMWILRKLPNACLAPRNIRPHMCRKEPSDVSQMVFSAASFARPEPSSRTATRPQPARPQPVKPQPPARPQPAKPQPPARPQPDSTRQEAMKTTQRATAGPTPPPVESHAKRTARQYCWRSMQGLCSLLIGWLPK